MSHLTFLVNLVGTVAFAISGAMTGIRKEMDLLGVIILGVVTAVGGGITRDIIMGQIPPSAFTDPGYALAAAIVSVVVFLILYFRVSGYQLIWGERFQRILFMTDTIGLAMFTVVGVQHGFHLNEGNNWFLAIFLGTITGVGGGVLRDLLVNDKPYIFYKHVYACASIAGAFVTCLLWNPVGEKMAMLAGAFVVMLIRMLAAHFRWNLPKISGDLYE